MSELDLALGLLDHQLVDVDGRRCGKVDDLAIEGGPGETPVVTAIIAGPGGWKTRGVMGRFVAAFARGRTLRIPWELVKDVSSVVFLKKSARELGLGRGDDRAARWVKKVPGA